MLLNDFEIEKRKIEEVRNLNMALLDSEDYAQKVMESRIYDNPKEYHNNNNSTEDPFKDSVSWDMLESIVFTKWINIRDSMDLKKIDFNFLSKINMSLYEYITITLKEYVEASFFKDEYYLGHFS